MADHQRSNSYKRGVLGGHGQDFQRNLAQLLLTRATLGRRPFKLGIEMVEDAGKFDDVFLFDQASDEWWLIQTKHAMQQNSVLTSEALLPKESAGKDGDFSLFKYFKSYLYVKQHWPHGGKRIRFFLFTNKEFDGSMEATDAGVDPMLKFPGAKHLQLKPDEKNLRALNDYINCDYDLMCEAIVRLFAGNGVDQVLKTYKLPLSEVLIKCNGNRVKFSESFNPNNPNWRLRKLHGSLVTAFEKFDKKISEISTPLPKEMHDFWTEKSRDKQTVLPLVDRGTVEKFFEDFVLSTSQPNAHVLVNIINDEWRFWMRGWIRPDVFGRLSEDQLTIPSNTFRRSFDKWEKRQENQSQISTFLELECGQKFLGVVERKLNSALGQYSEKALFGIDVSDGLYVNRRIGCVVKHEGECNESSKEYCQVSDSELVEQIYGRFADQRCMVLTAEPGMGKTTLWRYLAFRVQQQNPGTFVFLVYLNEFRQILPKVTSLDEALSILPISLTRKNSQLVKDGSQKVILFMDAFDEMNPRNVPPVFQLIEILKAQNNFKVLISSRIRVIEEIEQRLGVESMLLIPLDEKSQKGFLKRFWDVRDGIETVKFDNFMERIQRKFCSEFPKKDCDFMGLPITMKMIAEIYSQTFQQYLRSEDDQLSDEKLSNVDLYEQFTTKCIVMQYKKKNNLDADESQIIKTFQKQIEADKGRYQLLAMKVLIDNAVLNDITNEKFASSLDSFMNEILAGQQESLLIETIDGATRFSHLSYAEFFAARYLYDAVAKNEYLTKSQLSFKLMFSSPSLNNPFCQGVFNVLDNHKAIRTFFLAMVNAQTHPNHLLLFDQIDHRVAFWSCETNSCHLLEHLQKSHNFKAIRWTANNSMLHVAVESAALDALQLLLENPVGIDSKNAKYDTPLACASRNGNLDAVKLLVEKGANVFLTGHLHRTPLYLAASAGHTEIVDHLLRNSADANYRTKVLRESPLHRAAAHGKLDIVKLLIDAGADVNAVDVDRSTPLLNAVRRGHAEVVQYLSDHSGSLDSRDKDGWSPLHHAAKNGFLEIVGYLLGAGAEVDPMEHNGATPLQVAACFGHASVVQRLISSSADVFCRNRKGLTSLHCAAEKGFSKIIDLLIARGSNVNSADSIGRTPLHYAVRGGHLEVVRRLIDLASDGSSREERDTLNYDRRSLFARRAYCSGRTPSAWYYVKQAADVNYRDKDGCTPLHYAAERGFIKIVELLVCAGADVKAIDSWGKTPKNHAGRCGHGTVVLYLENPYCSLDRNNPAFLHYADGDKQIKQYLTVSEPEEPTNRKGPLHYAAELGHTDTVRHLLESNANDATIPDNKGMTPLHWASRQGFVDTVQQLIAAEVNVNATDNDSTTALHLAAKFGRTEVVRSLLNHAASINCRDEDGWTPLHYAADKGYKATAKLLIDSGADVNLTDELGCTALHRAAYSGHTDVVRFLIRHTTNLNRRDSWGQTALHYAAWKDLRDIVELLVDCGADVKALSDQQLTALDYAEENPGVREYLLVKSRKPSS